MSAKLMRIQMPAALLLAILAVSTASIFIRFAQKEASSLVIAAFRLTIAAVVMAPLALTRYRRDLGRLTRSDGLLAMLSGVFLAIHFATWITSLEYTSVASSVVLVSTSPLWVALLSPILLREPPTRSIFIGMSLALLGGTFIALSDVCEWGKLIGGGLICPPVEDFFSGQKMWGNFLALIGAWAVTGYLIIGRSLRARMALVPYIFLVYGMAAIVLISMILFTGQSPFGFSPIIYLWMLLLALIPQLIGHSTYNWALGYLPAAFVAITTLGEPIGSTILAYFILSEQPTWSKIIGGLLILTGIYISSQNPTKKPG